MLGKSTLDLNKTEFNSRVTKIVNNHRANSRIIGEPRQFILRACRLVSRWAKLAENPEVLLYCRNLELANGRKVKMLSLELGGTKQPVPKAKLVDALYPPKKTAATATIEEKHFNAVKAAMRQGVDEQLVAYKKGVEYPVVCAVSGKLLRKGARVDVDHAGKPFSQIADDFIRDYGLTYAEVVLAGPPTGKFIKDPDIWHSWKDYHEAHATYNLVCASANRKKGAAGYATPVELLGSFKPRTEDEIDLDF